MDEKHDILRKGCMEVKQTVDCLLPDIGVSFSPNHKIRLDLVLRVRLFLGRSAQLRWINRNLHEYHFSGPLSARATTEHRAASNSPDIELGACVRASSISTSRPLSYTCLIHCFLHACGFGCIFFLQLCS